MHETRAVWILAAVFSAVAVGCEKPPVEIALRHELPPAVPLPGRPAGLTAGTFEVRGEAGRDLAEFVRSELSACLEGGSPATRVDGTIEATVTDTRTTRRVRRIEPGGGDLQSVELPSLRREARVRIAFEIGTGEGDPHLTVETAADYDSTAESDARGELGLERPDDPGNVPQAEEIFRRLAAQCVEEFCGMIQPVVSEARIELRSVDDPRASQAMDAARQGRFDAARGVFRQIASDQAQNPAAWFNLAVLEEQTGKLAEAELHYGRVTGMTRGADREARQGRQRVRRILAARGVPAGRPAQE